MKKYDHIFFDLDRTLWDFDTNSYLAMEELYAGFRLNEMGIADFDKFHGYYKGFNDSLWKDYRDGKVEKDVLRWVRFYRTFEMYGIQDKALAVKMSDAYVDLAPRKPHLIPGVKSLLDQLMGSYQMHIITNGFSEIQHVKLASGGLTGYFGHVINSDNAGYQKPSRQIYDYALRVSGASASKSLMIGDDFIADVQGAVNAGLDAIWYNRDGLAEQPDFKVIQDMSRVIDYL